MDDPVRPGDILAQKYRVDGVLGVGGMGVVVAATHIHLDQKVALKLMLDEGFKNPEALARFQREARIVVKLRSEHVARVLDTGTLENGAPYIVMEYLEGSDLSADVDADGALPFGLAAEYIVQACDALAEAHALGIVHRDLKPANLFRTHRAAGSPLIKVLDFGISKLATEGEALSMTKTTTVMGSPMFMSPEQMRSSKKVDARSDIWSIGAVLYDLLTGQPPFDAETYADLVYMVMTENHKPVSTFRPDVPPAMAALIDRCLVKNADERVQSVADIAEALAPFCTAEGASIAARVAMVARAMHAPALAGPSGRVSSLPVAPTAKEATATQWGNTRNEPAPADAPRSLGRWLPLVAVPALAVFAVTGFLTLRHTAEVDPASTAPRTAAVAPLPLPANPAPPAPSTPPVAAAPAPTAASAAEPPSASPTVAPAPRPAPRPRGAQPVPAAPPAAHTIRPKTAPGAPSHPASEEPGILDTSN